MKTILSIIVFLVFTGNFLFGQVIVNLTPINATCYGACNGSITSSVTGGTPPYTYLWSNTQTIPNPTGLCAGTYMVTVTDAAAASGTFSATVAQPPILTAIISASTNVSCYGGTDGTATISASGGTPPYMYNWSNGVTIPEWAGMAGTYTVTVTDSNGCTATTSVTITEPPVLTVSITSSTNASCNGMCDGTATTTVSGGTSPYSCYWVNGQTTLTTYNVCAGNYGVSISDANGCTTTATATITEPAALTPSITGTLSYCAGSSTTLDAGSGYSIYSWSPSGNTQIINVTSAGNYSVTVTDANGCIGSDTVNVLSDNPITINITATQTGCSINNGTATANVSGGTPGYTYNWSNSQLTQTATGLGAETYIVTVTDAVNCTQTQTVTVTSNNTVTLTTSSTQTGCTTNNGTSTVLATGGITPYTYLWDNGQTTQTATGLDAGAYSVTVTDANGCTQTQTENVTQTPAPIAAVYALPTTIMQGDSSILTATGGITYQWSPGTGLSCYTCTNPIATPMQTTIYCVFVTDSNGCTDSTCIEITVETPCGEIFVPNAFSPNDDGSNELECVMGNCIQTFHFVIYDRWGEKVFETSDINRCWDGTYKGKLMNTAVFVYFIKATLTTGEKVTKKGNISLVR